MKKFKEKRMASYVFRSNELIQEGKTKEAAELIGKGLGYYYSCHYALCNRGCRTYIYCFMSFSIRNRRKEFWGKRNARMGRNSCRKAGTQRDKEN